MTASSFTSSGTLPSAFIGVAYEAAIGVSAPTNPTQITTNPGNDTGLPAGLVINADKTRITGTPTGAASTPHGTGVATSGAANYTFTVEPNTTDTSVVKQFTIPLYSAPNDRQFLESLGSTGAVVAQLGMGG